LGFIHFYLYCTKAQQEDLQSSGWAFWLLLFSLTEVCGRGKGWGLRIAIQSWELSVVGCRLSVDG